MAACARAEDLLRTSPLGLRLTKEGLNLALGAGSLEPAPALVGPQAGSLRIGRLLRRGASPPISTSDGSARSTPAAALAPYGVTQPYVTS